MVAPNGTEIKGNRGRTKSEPSEISDYFTLPIHRLFVTPLQSVGVLPINFKGGESGLDWGFSASAHSNRCIPDHSQEGKTKVQIPSNCGNRRDGFLCHHVIWNLEFSSCCVTWRVCPLCQINASFPCGRRVREGAQNKNHQHKQPPEAFPHFPPHICHNGKPVFANNVEKLP